VDDKKNNTTHKPEKSPKDTVKNGFGNTGFACQGFAQVAPLGFSQSSDSDDFHPNEKTPLARLYRNR
jgi:hypothetical protein